MTKRKASVMSSKNKQARAGELSPHSRKRAHVGRWWCLRREGERAPCRSSSVVCLECFGGASPSSCATTAESWRSASARRTQFRGTCYALLLLNKRMSTSQKCARVLPGLWRSQNGIGSTGDRLFFFRQALTRLLPVFPVQHIAVPPFSANVYVNVVS